MEAEGARAFQVSGDAYDRFMGRYSRSLAAPFADAASVEPGQAVLDVGCGPGALTEELVRRVGPDRVAAIDPSPPFVDDCTSRFPGVRVQLGRAESLPFADGTFDRVLAQLVLHFVSDAPAAATEFRRVLRPGGAAAACVWDFHDGMQLLRLFWDAALAVDPNAPDEARLRFGREGEITELLTGAGFVDVVERPLQVTSTYADFDELWDGYLGGVGPAGQYCLSLGGAQRAAVRAELFRRVGEPTGPVTLTALARTASGRVAH